MSVAGALGSALALAAAGAMARGLAFRRMAATVAARLPAAGPDGVVRGAEGLSLPGRGRGAVLLLHGFGDTPQSVAILARRLQADGWAVEAPLLPGHGRDLAAFAAASDADWLAAARSAWARVRATSPVAVLAGQSMGAALAVILAVESPPVALVLAAPFLAVTPAARRAARWRWLWGLVRPAVSTQDAASIQDPEARRQALGGGVVTPGTLGALVRVADRGAAAVPRLQAPTLLLLSREDNRIPPAVGEAIAGRFAPGRTTVVWRNGAGHVILADRGAEAVADQVAGWLEGTTGPSR